MSRCTAGAAFGIKTLWQLFVLCVVSMARLFDRHFVASYIKGLREGRRAVRSEEFRSIPSYCLTKK
jgi:hypothetical protein